MENALILVPKTGNTFLTNWNVKIYPKQVRSTREVSPRMKHIPVSRMYEVVGHKNINLFTITRDPYDQACSLFHYIHRTFDYALRFTQIEDDEIIRLLGATIFGWIMSNDNISKILEKVLVDKMSIEEYLENRPSNSMYSFYYDEKTPKDFHCVGITEEMDKTVILFEKMLGENIDRTLSNSNPDKKVGVPYETEYSRDDFMNKNQKEYELYFEAKERFKKLCDQEGIS